MQLSHTALVLPFFLASQVVAICPGYNYGIGNVKSEGSGISRWNVYDDSCKIVDGLTTTGNPCDEGIFSCSGNPLLFTGYTNTFSHTKYSCRKDPNAGSCGGDAISVCVSGFLVRMAGARFTNGCVPYQCRNDGN